MTRSLRFRLYPTRRQRAALDAQLADACALYNAALEQRRVAWRKGARFECVSCGQAADADSNAARVILARALALDDVQGPGRGLQAPTVAQAAVA